jgi:hypothetical protein
LNLSSSQNPAQYQTTPWITRNSRGWRNENWNRDIRTVPGSKIWRIERKTREECRQENQDNARIGTL